ncbi:hypothetical protein AB4Y85_07260 [Microvirga sp. 2YAF29]|uniref:hypothetical protein n=1 Tax=Microvirga sp. 2YAF29 TaxID=3233031 RepID=UPI003F95DF9A
MKWIPILVLILVGIISGSAPAWAHRPYFTQVEKVRLPDGEMGEARLLNGDGILGPDPIRAIIVTAEGRLLARSHKSHSMTIICREEGQCLIFDFAAEKILEPVPSSFRQGPLVPGLADSDRDELWELEDGLENWGFASRDLSTGEMFLGYKALVSSRWPIMAFNFVIGALCALLLAFAITILKETIVAIKEKGNWFFLIFMTSLAILIIAAMALFLALVSGFFSLLGGLPLGLWLASLCLGGVFVPVCFQFRKGSRMRSGLEQEASFAEPPENRF